MKRLLLGLSIVGGIIVAVMFVLYFLGQVTFMSALSVAFGCMALQNFTTAVLLSRRVIEASAKWGASPRGQALLGAASALFCGMLGAPHSLPPWLGWAGALTCFPSFLFGLMVERHARRLLFSA